MKNNSTFSTLGIIISVASMLLSMIIKDEIIAQLLTGLSILSLLPACQQMQKSASNGA